MQGKIGFRELAPPPPGDGCPLGRWWGQNLTRQNLYSNSNAVCVLLAALAAFLVRTWEIGISMRVLFSTISRMGTMEMTGKFFCISGWKKVPALAASFRIGSVGSSSVRNTPK